MAHSHLSDLQLHSIQYIATILFLILFCQLRERTISNLCKLNVGAQREEQTMALLAKFKSKLSTVNTLSSQYEDTEETTPNDEQVDNEEETDDGWLVSLLFM